MGTYVTVLDVRRRFEQDIPTGQAAYVEAVIDEAETLLAARVPALADLITAGTTTAGVVKTVITRAVLRVLRNPGGYASEQAGDYSYRLDRNVASGLLDFTADDLALITGNAGGVRMPRTIGIRPPSMFQVDLT